VYQTERCAKVIEHQKSNVYHHLKDKIREDFECNHLASSQYVYQKNDLKEFMKDFQFKWSIRDIDSALIEFGTEYKNHSGNRKGCLITREMVGADPVQVKGGLTDQSKAFSLI
jgi:hypothetical protein